jgi:RNA polymerase sigma-70 factor (ECF subfamily)
MSTASQARGPISDDEEVVRQFQMTGDPDCFAELFARHRKRIYFACLGFFSDGGAAAEDATQETFLRAFQNIQRFRGGNFCGWLLRIARNACIDRLRKKWPETGHEEMEGYEQPAAATPEQMSDLRFAVEKIQKEMALLPAEQRRCLELKIDGCSYEETAERTGLPLEAVKSHLQNGRRMLWMKMAGILSQLK